MRQKGGHCGLICGGLRSVCLPTRIYLVVLPTSGPLLLFALNLYPDIMRSFVEAAPRRRDIGTLV